MTDELELATRLLRVATADKTDVGSMPAGRDVAIARIADALSRRRAARRRRIAIGVIAAAAAVVLVGAFALKRTPPPSELARIQEGAGVTLVGPKKVTSDGRVAEGAELRVEKGAEARLDFDSGTVVRVADDARVRFVDQTKRKRFALDSGSFAAKVAKLGGEDRFVVATPDAEVEVRGTEFVVRVVKSDSACGDTRTRVDVSEGVVVVRHGGSETPIRAGEHWPSCEPTAAIPASAVVAAEPKVAAPPRIAHRPAAPEASSTLGEQNDLFQEAMADKRHGATAAAVSKLDQLLARHPSGPFAETAAIEKMRLVSGATKERAARDYLARFPRGSARAEAEAIVNGEPYSKGAVSTAPTGERGAHQGPPAAVLRFATPTP